MTVPTKSALFHVEPDSWLGLRLDSGQQDVCSVKVALALECKPNKGEALMADLQESLAKERDVIGTLPDEGNALRGDKVEKARASECHAELSPSVDVYIGRSGDLLLVECKYKAFPETQIVKSEEAFRFYVIRKFEASIAFLEQQGAAVLPSDRIVLFNADSKDKVISMFRRLQLQNDSQELSPYLLMDTTEFGARYMV